jgi:hypothetical protein
MIVTNQTIALGTNDLHDIRPPVVIPTGWEWLWWVLAALALGVALWWAWRWWQRRRVLAAVVPPVPAHVRARQKLRDALLFIAQPKAFCIAVSGAIRGYLEERFEFHAPERTTEEFLHELQDTDLLVAEQKVKLGEFLASCDLVKFAKYEPGETELRELYGSAMRLVDETVPQAETGNSQLSIAAAEPELVDRKS